MSSSNQCCTPNLHLVPSHFRPARLIQGRDYLANILPCGFPQVSCRPRLKWKHCFRASGALNHWGIDDSKCSIPVAHTIF